jgi:DNA damage-binding protein 1
MTLTYLSSSHLFVGSHFGDSIITAILPQPRPYTGSYVSPVPLLTLPNLAPILDFWKDGEEGDVVTCSGGQNTGSIRIVRRGVGLVEGVVVDGIEGVQGIWGLKSGASG